MGPQTVRGPTQTAVEGAANEWAPRPRVAAGLRLAIFLFPYVVGFLFAVLIGWRFPAHTLGINPIVWFVGVAALSTLLMIPADRFGRRLVPMAGLLTVALGFPDAAPSRFKAAMRATTTAQVQRRVEHALASDVHAAELDRNQYLLDLVSMLTRHDRFTRGHSERVRAYSTLIGEEVHLSKADHQKLYWAGLLHDIGKLDVPGEILNKSGRPDDDEWMILQGHPGAGSRYLAPVQDWLGDWSKAATEHHLRWDGNGYPRSLAGTDISLAGRIVAIADAYDVMTSTRSYKSAMSAADARVELSRCAGSQFDPQLVRAFLNIGLQRVRLAGGVLVSLPVLVNSILSGLATNGGRVLLATTAVSTGVAAGPLVEAVSPVPVEIAAEFDANPQAIPRVPSADASPTPTSMQSAAEAAPIMVVPATPTPTATLGPSATDEAGSPTTGSTTNGPGGDPVAVTTTPAPGSSAVPSPSTTGTPAPSPPAGTVAGAPTVAVTTTPEPSPTPELSPTPESTGRRSPTATSTPTPTATATVTPTSTVAATPTPQPAIIGPPATTVASTPSPTIIPVPRVTPSPTATAVPSPQPTATRTPAPTPTATRTPAPTPTPTATATPAPTPTLTPTPTPTLTPTPTPTLTPTPTPTQPPTPTLTPTPTATPTPAATPTATAVPGAAIVGVDCATLQEGQDVGDRADLVGCDLSGLDLRGANLAGADLGGANLAGADLSDADLTDVKGQIASFVDADLSGANLEGARLQGADLTGAVARDVILVDVTLQDAVLVDADLRGADLTGALVQDADLNGVNLTGATVVDANLNGVDLTDADVSDADFTGADLTDALLVRAVVDGAAFDGAILRRTDFTDATGTPLAAAATATFASTVCPDTSVTSTGCWS